MDTEREHHEHRERDEAQHQEIDSRVEPTVDTESGGVSGAVVGGLIGGAVGSVPGAAVGGAAGGAIGAAAGKATEQTDEADSRGQPIYKDGTSRGVDNPARMQEPVGSQPGEFVDAAGSNEPGDQRLPPVGPNTPDPRDTRP